MKSVEAAWGLGLLGLVIFLIVVLRHRRKTPVEKAKAQVERGLSRMAWKNYDKAIRDYDELINLRPGLASSFINRGSAKLNKKDYEHAIEDSTKAIQLQPDNVAAFNNRGAAWQRMKQLDRALLDYNEAILREPANPVVLHNRGFCLATVGKFDEANHDLDKSVQMKPDGAPQLNSYAWFLAVCPVAKYRDGRRALELATKACELTTWNEPTHLGTLAAAYAEIEDFNQAVHWLEKAMQDSAYMEEFGDMARQRMQLYEQKKPYRENWPLSQSTPPPVA